MNPELISLTCALHDSLMLLAPRGWTQVDMKTRVLGNDVRVAELSSKGEGTKEPPPKPKLNVEPREEAVRLGEGLAEIRHRLAHEGKSWSGESLRIQRTPQFVEWVLIEGDQRPAASIRLKKEQLETLLITDELFDALRGTDPSFETLQARFEAQVKEVEALRFDPSNGVLFVETASGETPHTAEVVGVYEGDAFAWQWAWSDEALPAKASAAVKRVCAPSFQSPGMSAFWRPGFHCDEGFAWALAGHVCVSIGARGLLRAPESEHGKAVVYAVL